MLSRPGRDEAGLCFHRAHKLQKMEKVILLHSILILCLQNNEKISSVTLGEIKKLEPVCDGLFFGEQSAFLLVFQTFAWVLLLKVDCGPSSVSTSVNQCQIYMDTWRIVVKGSGKKCCLKIASVLPVFLCALFFPRSLRKFSGSCRASHS